MIVVCEKVSLSTHFSFGKRERFLSLSTCLPNEHLTSPYHSHSNFLSSLSFVDLDHPQISFMKPLFFFIFSMNIYQISVFNWVLFNSII
ncbi:hypothetical protein L1887_16634 [Cichorium endivia]|nr:hypothetical protein L1887_16634 [Cichorium endivia]